MLCRQENKTMLQWCYFLVVTVTGYRTEEVKEHLISLTTSNVNQLTVI